MFHLVTSGPDDHVTGIMFSDQVLNAPKVWRGIQYETLTSSDNPNSLHYWANQHFFKKNDESVVMTIDQAGDIEMSGTLNVLTDIQINGVPIGSGGLADIVDDVTPQLGGTLDANGFNIDMGVNLITDTKVGQWDTAFGWGDHGVAGYITGYTETDPVFLAHDAAAVTAGAIANWNTAFGWGNHASAGYLSSETSHADVVVDGDFGSNGILKRTSAGVYGIVTDNSSNWDTAFGWGNHGSAGYMSDLSDDFSPSLSGPLLVNNQQIASVSNGNIDIAPHGTGLVLLGTYTLDTNQSIGIGVDGYALTYDNSVGKITLKPIPGGGLANIVEDVTPQLGATLDANGFNIDMGANVITDAKVGQWITAYGWGNHASAGYLTAVPNGDKGDIAVSGGGATWTIDPGVVTLAKMANMATASLIGRSTAGTGVPQVLSATAVRTLLNIENGADVTDAANVDSAGAVMNSDSSTASMSFVIDEDSFASNSSTKVPTQQSVKAYVDASGGGGIGNVVEDLTPQLGGDLDGLGRNLDNMGVIFLNEQASADGDVSGDGQIWVKTNSPNLLMFTDDTGQDFNLSPDEGTFTPWISDQSYSSGEGQTYYTQSGVYTVIGDVCLFWITLTINSLGSMNSTDDCFVQGLPFSALSDVSVSVGDGTSLGVTAGSALSGYIESGSTRIRLRLWDSVNGATDFKVSELSAGGGFIMHGFYRI